MSSLAQQKPSPPERAPNDVRGTAAADAAALLAAEVERCRVAARKTLASLKDTVAALERSCDEAIGGGQAAAQAGVTAFADKLAAAAAAAANTAAERARAEVRSELEKVQASLTAAKAELEKAREQLQAAGAKVEKEQSARAQAEAELKREREALKTTGEKLQAEQTARAHAERALKDAEKARQELAGTHESQLKALRAELEGHQAQLARAQQQIDAEKAERSRLVNAIRGVVDPGESAAAAADLKPTSKPKEPARTPAAAASAPAPERKPQTESKTDAADKPAEPEGEPELVAYVQHLFNTLESMYTADVSAGRKSDDLLNRLTQNLRSARNVFRNHIGADEGDLKLFDQQLAALLGNPEETAFARHLGIAAYECSKAERA